MRLVDDTWRCVQCGAVLDLPADVPPIVTIKAASGQPDMRTIIVKGREIHRCQVAARSL